MSADLPAPRGEGPVFIVGAPRSGTSILYRTLLKHPAFRVEGDVALQLAESAILETLPNAPRWRIPRPPRLWRFFLQDESGYGAFLEEVRKLTDGRPPAPSDRPPPWTAPVLEAFVRHASATRSCHRLLEKTPTHIERADWLLDSLPASRLLFVHRHPLHTYTSYRRRAAVDPKARWADLSVEEFASVYERHTVLARTMLHQEPDRFLAVSYEIFTTTPDAETERICRFLEEDFHPFLVEEPAPDLGRSKNDPHLFGEITPDTKEWTEYIDGETAHRVEEATKGAAKEWGYERLT